MELKFNLEQMLKEIEDDKKTLGSYKKKWASQDDIEAMRKERKQRAARKEDGHEDS